MEFEANKNMILLFLILLIISIGIAYFLGTNVDNTDAEINSAEIAELKKEIESKNEQINQLNDKLDNFSYQLLKSMSLLDVSREIRGNGNLYFDYAARIWYPQKNYTKVINNCSKAMETYDNASAKFDLATDFFLETKNTTTNSSHHEILDSYVTLTQSGYSLSMLRYNASLQLKNIAKRLANNTEQNKTELLEEFNTTLMQADAQYQQMFTQHQNIIEKIEEGYGDFFNPKREP